jgi:SAM-dependent methyltransferase
VRTVYRLALRREPEPAAIDDAVSRLQEGGLSRATLLRDVVRSAEFERMRAVDDGLALAARARRNGERPRELNAPSSCDERAIEIPWTLSRYRGESRVLDVGYALAVPAWTVGLAAAAAPAEVVGVDLTPTETPLVRGIVADVRDLPFAGGAFDVVFCISTLEHVGVQGGDEYDQQATAALRELHRVLRRGGRVLVTVPCGATEDHDDFVQRPVASWLELFRGAGFDVFEHEAYSRGAEEWSAVEDEPGRPYDVGRASATCVLCAELRRSTMLSRARGVVRG